jgi:Tfp pilus assembly protein PilF
MKRAFIASGFLLSLALLPAPVAAQGGTAKGKIVDSAGNGLAEATVQVVLRDELPRKYELTTSKSGDYIQVGLYPGLYRFIASKEGYQPNFVEHRVRFGDPTQIPDVVLKSGDEVLKEQGRPTEALKEKFTEAVGLANSGELDEAEVLFKEILEEASNIPEVHQNLAFIYARRKDWATAEASYLKALELSPGDPGITSGLVQVYLESGQQAKAEELVNQAAGGNPEDANAQFSRAVFLVNSGNMEEALSAFEAALAADPSMAEAHYHLGTLLVGQGKVPEAIQHLETYLSMDPSNEQNIATANGLIAALKQ